MNKIQVYEQQNTTNGISYGVDNVAYVPGFATGGDAEYRQPVYCDNLETFVEYFGQTAARFGMQQYYPVGSSKTSGFETTEIPGYTGTSEANYPWYTANDYDPAYAYAYNLIAAGIPVVYEKLNQTNLVLTSSITEYDTSKDVYPITDANSQYTDGTIVIRNSNTSITITQEIVRAGVAGGSRAWINYAPGVKDWAANTSYAAGDIVWGKLSQLGYYQCNTAHTSSTTPKSTELGYWTSYTPEQCIYDVSVQDYYYQVIGMPTESTEEEYTPGSVYVSWTGNPVYDKGQFSVKFLTTGGWPNYKYTAVESNGATGRSLHTYMTNAAKTRDDAIAMIDHTNYYKRKLVGTTSVYNGLKTSGLDNGQYATMFTPWANYNGIGQMPASFAYFMCLGNAITTGNSRMAIAGAVRGLVPGLTSLNTQRTLSNSVADSYQQDPSLDSGGSINPITYINPYGYCIWGNRTLVNGNSAGFASEFLNQRAILCDIKKRIYRAATAYMFEQNNDTLWVNFSTMITELLDTMVTENSIIRYEIKQNSTTDKTKLSATITIYPQYAVESFEIYIYMTDESTEVTSNE